jgi:hypothetical protein
MEREMTDAEYADYQQQMTEFETSETAKAEAEAEAATDRTALLARLGITAEEAALLLGGTN